MSRLLLPSLLALVWLSLLSPALAAELPRPVAQVPLLNLAPGDHPDLEAFLSTWWAKHYRTAASNAFGPDSVRIGRFDLDEDGEPELVLMIDNPKWDGAKGKPMVVAGWTGEKWFPLGWSWGDEDTVFVTTEMRDGWRTLDSGTFLLRWFADSYREQAKR